MQKRCQTASRYVGRVATRITTRNARFQQWQALLGNRTKRQRAREFLVQGVRPISLAVERRWPVRTLIVNAARPPSAWAAGLLRTTRAEQVSMAPELLAVLAEKAVGDDAEAPELVAVLEIPDDDPRRIPVPDDFLGVLFDRPTSPGNIGSIVRSADAFGAHGVIVSGHAADVYDPKSVRASTGSLFAVPTVRVPSAREVTDWLAGHPGVQVVGTDEHGESDVFDFDLTGPTLLLIGNETTGLSAGWRDLADHLVRIPMTGSASSLNAASAATAVLYEAARQRLSSRPASPRSGPVASASSRTG
jgi:tRNA G18 (ribose-2'-O)-methylase SpoU